MHETVSPTNVQDTYQSQDDDRPTLEGLRRQYASEYAALMAWVRDDERRRVIAALVNHEALPYDELTASTSLSRRRTRSHVYAMRDAGILDVTNSNVAFVHFADDDLRLLAEDVLSFFF